MISQHGSCTASEIYQSIWQIQIVNPPRFFVFPPSRWAHLVLDADNKVMALIQRRMQVFTEAQRYFWCWSSTVVVSHHRSIPRPKQSLRLPCCLSRSFFFSLVVFAASLPGSAHFSCYFQISLFCHTLTCSLNKTLIFNERRRWLVAEHEEENIYLDL